MFSCYHLRWEDVVQKLWKGWRAARLAFISDRTAKQLWRLRKEFRGVEWPPREKGMLWKEATVGSQAHDCRCCKTLLVPLPRKHWTKSIEGLPWVKPTSLALEWFVIKLQPRPQRDDLETTYRYGVTVPDFWQTSIVIFELGFIYCIWYSWPCCLISRMGVYGGRTYL